MILHGDCLDLLPSVADGSVDMVFADLPYGVTANKWDSVIPFGPLWTELLRVGKRNAAFVFTATFNFACRLDEQAERLGLNGYDIIWRKGKATGHLNANRMPMRQHELVLIYYRSQPTYNPQKTAADKPVNKRGKAHVGGSHGTNYGAGSLLETKQENLRHPSSVVDFFSVPPQHSVGHPTQKPVALLEWLVKTYTNPGETVLDPTMGSGTTGVACINTARKFIGIEKDAGYFATAQNRLAMAQPPLPGAA